MSLPTLLIKGKLHPPNGDAALKRELDEWTPIAYILDWLRIRLSKTGIENRVLVLKSETASGKSTLLPAEIYKSLVRGTGEHAPGIICTQPRTMTAIENVNDILKHNAKTMRLGETIGWSTKHNKLRPTTVGLLSATIGTLEQQLKTMTDEEIIAKYRYILIDETHERGLQTDMAIYMLKNLLMRNKNNINCPYVLLMSATFDPQSFLNYFDVPAITNFIWCVGETVGFDEMWEWNQSRTVNDYARAAAEVVERIVTENPDDPSERADILIFMPGRAEFIATMGWLTKLNIKLAAADKKVLSILQIDSVAVQKRNLDYVRTMYIPVSEHEIRINAHTYTPSRRVIISTNVAETGLTLDNLKYVIDGGFNREVEYNPVLNIRGLITKPAPKSRIRQRKGRAGRKHRGVFYPLYPMHIYDKLPDLQLPQILIEDVNIIAMDIISEQLKVKRLAGEIDPEFLIKDIDMIDVPTPDALAGCIEKLYTIGFISPIDYADELMKSSRFKVTKLGTIAGRLSLSSPESIRMILAAYSWGCSVLDVITIAAYLAIEFKSFIGTPAATDGVNGSDLGPPATSTRVDINWQPIYKLGLPGFISGTGLLYKIRLLIADDFISGLILFNAIKHILDSASARDAVRSLRDWCDTNHVSYQACIEFIRVRDDIIEQMLTAEMEIFAQEDRALYRTTADDFMTTITQIKYCIYDGYRGNLLTRVGNEYRTSIGLTVTPPTLFREDEKAIAEKNEYGFAIGVRPRIVLYKELSLKYNRKSFMYDVRVDRISTCDGFVNIDADFAV